MTTTLYHSGILCIILGVVVYVMDLRCPQLIATFFNADVIQDSEEVQVESMSKHFFFFSLSLSLLG